MAYLLDTNIAIELRDGDPDVLRKLSELDAPVMISVVTRVELEGGVYRDPAQAAARRPRLDAMLASLPAIDFGEEAANEYRNILVAAGYSRRKLLDRMIAAQAIAHRATLITRNAADFRDCPGLRLLEW